MLSTQISATLSPLGLEQYDHRFEEDGFDLCEIILVVTKQHLDTIGRNKEYRISLQQEILPAHASAKRNLKLRNSTYGKSVFGIDMTKRVRRHPKYTDITLKRLRTRTPRIPTYLSFPNKLSVELGAVNTPFTAIMQKVGQLWQDVPEREKKIYLALLAKHRITKHYKNCHQYLTELKVKSVSGFLVGRDPTFLRSLASNRDFDYRLPEGSWAWNDRAFCKYWRLPDWSSDLEYLSWCSDFIGLHAHPRERLWQLSAVSFYDPQPEPALPPDLAARFDTCAYWLVKYWMYEFTEPDKPNTSLLSYDATGTRPPKPDYRFPDQRGGAIDGQISNITRWLKDTDEHWVSVLAKAKVPEVLPSIAPNATHESLVTSNNKFSPFLLGSSNQDDDTSGVAAVSSEVKQTVDVTKPKYLAARKRIKTGCLTCRKRLIKCDEERPSCRNCAKSKRKCHGYNTRTIFKEPFQSYHPKTRLHYVDIPSMGDRVLMLSKRLSSLRSLPPDMELLDPVRAGMDFVKYRVFNGFSFRTSKARLTMQWDLLAFMGTQFVASEDAKLGSVIILNGTAQNAQATTCLEYAEYNWPLHGSTLIRAFQSAIDNRYQMDQATNTNPEITISLADGFCALVVQSEDHRTVAEILQQAIWMGTALRTSQNEQVQYSNFHLSESMQDPSLCSDITVTFDTSELSEQEQCCWLPLFANPVIARGFPVPERKNGERGLEIPLEIMAALGGARHVTEFEGGLVMKGYSAMFVPVKRHHQSVQWHLIRRSDEQRILYRDVSKECPSRAMLEEVGHASLKNTKAFLGWWRSAETHLGTADAAYVSIDWSPASETRSSARISGASLGFQNMFTGQLSFSMGAKDGRLHFSQKGPFQRIVQCAERTPVVLYDPADRRGWCVQGLDLMLHVIQTRHHLSPYQIDGKRVELTPAMPKNGRAAAAAAIAANQQRQLYEHNVATENIYYFKDAVLDIWSQMERLMEKEDSMEACAGLALHGTMRSKVHGWEFMSLVHEKNYRRKEAAVAKSSGGWVDLINDVDALVLFATGLDELIRPVSDLSNLCRSWRTLPKGKDFLAAGVPIMELFYSEAGSRLSRKHLSTSHLQWHRGSTLFEPCGDVTSNRCKCDRTQQIYHDSLFRTFGHVRPPGELEENGCVVFGQAHHSFKPNRSFSMRQNAVHILPNTPIKIGETNRHSPTKDGPLLSPPPAAFVSPEPEEINDHASHNSESPPSPLHSTDSFMRDKTITLRKKRKLSHIHLPVPSIREWRDICNDEELLSDEEVAYPTKHQSLLEDDTTSKRQKVASTPTGCASEDEYEPAPVPNSMRQEAKIEH